MKHIILLHGFASSSRSKKASFLKEKFSSVENACFHGFEFSPTIKDFEYLTVTGMINRLRQYVLDRDLSDVRLLGSSLGSLVGLHYAARFGQVERMLLMAPVLRYPHDFLTFEERMAWKRQGSIAIDHLHFKETVSLRHDFHLDGLGYDQFVTPKSPVTIIHGCNDETVPVESSRGYALEYPEKVDLVEVEDDHRLMDSLEEVWRTARSFLLQ